VSEIQNLTSAAKWRFMPTQSSSADIVSRGCTVTELDASIWFTGPPFLYEGISKWPVAKNAVIDLAIVNCEKRKHIFSATTTNNYLVASLEKHRSYISGRTSIPQEKPST